MIKSAFQNPHHVAIRILVCAPPRCFSAENSGAGGGGSWHCAKKYKNKVWSFPRCCAKVEPYSRFVWANSVIGILPLLILDGPNHYRLAVPVNCTMPNAQTSSFPFVCISPRVPRGPPRLYLGTSVHGTLVHGFHPRRLRTLVAPCRTGTPFHASVIPTSTSSGITRHGFAAFRAARLACLSAR